MFRAMRRMSASVPLAGLLLLGSAGLPRAEPTVNATYATYAHLIDVLDLEASLDLRSSSYGIRVVTHTAGPVRLFLRSDIETSVSGTFTNGAPRPSLYNSTGRVGGEPRVTVIDYGTGAPIVRTLVPPNSADEREEVPASDTARTVDTLSAMALLMRQVTDTGRCDGSLTTFDGRRLAVLTARTEGEDVLEPTGRSSFAGPALRCTFEGRQIAGFKLDGDLARERRPQRGTAWFARPVPGGPALPVRITFESRILGEATMYLSSVSLAQPAGAQPAGRGLTR